MGAEESRVRWPERLARYGKWRKGGGDIEKWEPREVETRFSYRLVRGGKCSKDPAQNTGGKLALTYFILISLCFFSLAFTKAVGSKRGARLPKQCREEAGLQTNRPVPVIPRPFRLLHSKRGWSLTCG